MGDDDLATTTGKGCAYFIAAILLLIVLYFFPAIMGVGELADQHRERTRIEHLTAIEAEQTMEARQ